MTTRHVIEGTTSLSTRQEDGTESKRSRVFQDLRTIIPTDDGIQSHYGFRLRSSGKNEFVIASYMVVDIPEIWKQTLHGPFNGTVQFGIPISDADCDTISDLLITETIMVEMSFIRNSYEKLGADLLAGSSLGHCTIQLLNGPRTIAILEGNNNEDCIINKGCSTQKSRLPLGYQEQPVSRLEAEDDSSHDPPDY